ncbi:MAG: hypothetical protein HZC55_24310 [Verrucomicrobia bacterium]|nr:hypothetical protein [Verrucomicrobiota bacterium]
MSSATPLIYLVLGATGSGRRELLADLVEAGLEADDRAAVLLPASEAPQPDDPRLPSVHRWEWRDGTVAAALPAGHSHVFFLVDGRRNPVDQIEAFRAWLESQGATVARVFCVVDCQFASRHPALLAWYEACVHFSDAVLLHRREGVENKWVSDFLGHFKKEHLPCLFELVKEGRVKNPALLLEPQARRLSQVFDAEQDWVLTDAEGEEIDEEDVTGDEEEEVTAAPAEDPYFARRMGGRRVRELPDIAAFLDAPPPSS